MMLPDILNFIFLHITTLYTLSLKKIQGSMIYY